MYDSITPAQWVVGLVISLSAFGALAWLLWHFSLRNMGMQHMSTSAEVPRSDSAGLDQSKDQSALTSLEPQTTPAPEGGLKPNSPDMDAKEWEMPRISAYLTDDEFLVML